MQFTMTISWLIILLLKQPRINHSGINYGISFICLKAAEFFLIIYASIKTSNGEKYKYPITIPLSNNESLALIVAASFLVSNLFQYKKDIANSRIELQKTIILWA
jgi:uncharacterized membrane protein